MKRTRIYFANEQIESTKIYCYFAGNVNYEN